MLEAVEQQASQATARHVGKEENEHQHSHGDVARLRALVYTPEEVPVIHGGCTLVRLYVATSRWGCGLPSLTTGSMNETVSCFPMTSASR